MLSKSMTFSVSGGITFFSEIVTVKLCHFFKNTHYKKPKREKVVITPKTENVIDFNNLFFKCA